jgi:anti-sigma B factor antagonist
VGDLADFAVSVQRRDDCVVVRIDGELDMSSAAALEEAISSLTSAPYVVLDLRACTFLDSAGIRVLTATMRQVPRVSVVATDPGVLRALEITAVDTIVPVHASLEDAL